jgi:hypothetical protein
MQGYRDLALQRAGNAKRGPAIYAYAQTASPELQIVNQDTVYRSHLATLSIVNAVGSGDGWEAAVNDWCRQHRHWSIRDQHRHLSSMMRGHFAYYGVGGNSRRGAQDVVLSK